MFKKIVFDEAKQSQLPFVELLINMGYNYISPKDTLQERGGNRRQHLLQNIALKQLSKINGNKFSDNDIKGVIDDMENIAYKGLIETSKDIFSTIMSTAGGKTIQSKSFRFFDFEYPEKNSFHVSAEVAFEGMKLIRPDIVCFINGIPLAIIECKKSSVEVKQAINQMSTNQKADYCPKLFTYAQLLVATNINEFKYGATGADHKFYSNWREDDLTGGLDKQIIGLISSNIDGDLYKKLLQDLNSDTENHQQLMSREITEQDRGVVSLFDKHRILDLIKNYIIFDGGAKKITRHSQYFAIAKIKERIYTNEYGYHDKMKRCGGLIWHTQGTGKSILMVMLVKFIIEDPNIKNPRIIIVTDRKDLDRQISNTFDNCNLKKDIIRATSGEHLLELIKNKDPRIITTLVHKFQAVGKKKSGLIDDDPNIFVIIDEAHRTQGGIANLEMNSIIPNACYLGFTGTPLMQHEQESWRKFGGYIDQYTINDAHRDSVVLPLVYQGRYAKLKQNKEMIDKKTDRFPREVREETSKYITKSLLSETPERIKEIALDVTEHYIEHFQGTGLKGQVVAPSKYAAVTFQKEFESLGQIRTAVVISDENDKEITEPIRKEVAEYIKKVRDNQSLEAYEKDIISSFKENHDGIELIIVVDKLLTGFDAPRNTVLYLAKELHNHNLLQAIARVNRIFDNKEGSIPKTEGYIIDYSENAENINDAMELFSNYDQDDIANALTNSGDKITEFKNSYSALHGMFKGLKHKKDIEAYIKYLEDEELRKQFYKKLSDVLRGFSQSLILGDFVQQNGDKLNEYRESIKRFMEIRKAASLRYADRVDMSEYKEKLRAILDKYIDVEEIEIMTKEVNIYDKEMFSEALQDIGSNRSKAEAIAAQITRTIKESYSQDPQYYKKLSDKIEEILNKMRQDKLNDLAAIDSLFKLQSEMAEKETAGIPEEIRQHPVADVLYRNLEAYLPNDHQEYTKIIINIINIIRDSAIVDWHKNSEVQRQMENKLDDYIYDVVSKEYEIRLTTEQRKEIIDEAVQLAINNHERIKA